MRLPCPSGYGLLLCAVLAKVFLLLLFSTLVVHADEVQVLTKTVISEIDTWGLTRPQKLELASACESLYLGRGQHGLNYDPKSHLISYLGLAKYPKEFHSVFIAHEYGHAVFRASLKRVSVELDDHMERSLEYRSRLQAELRKSEFCFEPDKLLSPDFLAFEKGFSDLDYFTFAALKLGAYDELLADIFAVLYAGRGDAMYLALGGTAVDWSQKYFVKLPVGYRGRDFTYSITIEKASDEKRKMVFYDFLGSISDMYNVLDPVRSYLWDKYLRNLQSHHYGPFIKAYLSAVGEEYKYYSEHNVWEQPVREMNERFIANLDKQMSFLLIVSNEAEPSWKTLPMNVVIESRSSWTTASVSRMVRRANNLLAQCHISVAIKLPWEMFLGTLAMDYESIEVANQFYNDSKTPMLFLIETRQYSGSAGWAPGSNYLFISSYSLSDEYKKLRNPEYEILAHELGHMLGGLKHLSDGQNLMAGYIANQTAQLTKEQCASMRSSIHLNEENLF